MFAIDGHSPGMTDDEIIVCEAERDGSVIDTPI
jgi:hypothetical protein